MQASYLLDAQAALGFVTSQRSHIESEVLEREYPEIKYSTLIPVDTQAPEFAASVTFFAQDHTGRAKFINGKGSDVPLVNLSRSKFEQTVNMGGIGYDFSLEEIGAAQDANVKLSTEGANAARQAYEQHVDAVALSGEDQLGVEGFFDMTGVTSTAASKTFATSTPQEILAELNDELTAIYKGSLGVDMADTIVLPLDIMGRLSSTQLAPESDMMIIDLLRRSNIYTAETGRELNITGSHRLSGKAVIYRRDPAVVKMHMPMPLRFIAPQPVGLSIVTLGMYRFAPVNIRRPGAVRYLTGI
ncbi:MAG: major capsid family protein [Pseudomonadota bacterium]